MDIYEIAKQTSIKYPHIDFYYLHKILQQIAWKGVIDQEELLQLNECVFGGRK